MKHTFFSILCIASVVGGLYYSHECSNPSVNTFFLENIEALSDNENSHYHYPKKDGKAQKCKLIYYKNISTESIIGNGSDIPYLDNHLEYVKFEKEGIMDTCPDKGDGCNPFSCQEVAYVP